MKFAFISIFALLLFVLNACRSDKVLYDFKSEHFVVVVIDGPRYSETWGDSGYQNIPFEASILGESVFCSDFRNEGITFTVPGHTAITTGRYQDLSNVGAQLPLSPSFFQYWLKFSGADSTDAWVIASKDKLEVLSNCEQPDWKDRYRPSTDCGVNGNGTGYRSDSITLARAVSILSTNKPKLTLINLRNPDYIAHQGDSLNYIQAIKEVDSIFGLFINFLDTDPEFAGKTALFVTNDHGRHLPGISNGFAGHGDGCDGCRKIGLVCKGPDFRKDVRISEPYHQLDISKTIAFMLNMEMPSSEGRVMKDLFLELPSE